MKRHIVVVELRPFHGGVLECGHRYEGRLWLGQIVDCPKCDYDEFIGLSDFVELSDFENPVYRLTTGLYARNGQKRKLGSREDRDR